MQQVLKLSEYEKRTGSTPAMTKKLIKEGVLRGGQNGPGGHWTVIVEENDDISDLKKIIVKQDEKISMLCRHLGLQV